ncbi:hypothetical protein AB4259_19510 [Vibrio amylolyticus]|uniref:hypothetical protein n=1 Tax=Vibrio amylolyticus TaxID=2847292 RepID=UPI0035532DFE
MSLLCPHCPNQISDSDTTCPNCGLPICGASLLLVDGELQATTKHSNTTLTFIKNENIDNGYGISRTLPVQQISRESISHFVKAAQTLL